MNKVLDRIESNVEVEEARGISDNTWKAFKQHEKREYVKKHPMSKFAIDPKYGMAKPYVRNSSNKKITIKVKNGKYVNKVDRAVLKMNSKKLASLFTNLYNCESFTAEKDAAIDKLDEYLEPFLGPNANFLDLKEEYPFMWGVDFKDPEKIDQLKWFIANDKGRYVMNMIEKYGNKNNPSVIRS